MALRTQQIDTDEEASGFLRDLRKQSIWRLAPLGYWIEEDNSRVIFDGFYQPIFRIRADGLKEIVPSDEVIRFYYEHHYHMGFGADPDPETRAIVSTLIEFHGLKPELSRRKELLRLGQLPPRRNPIEVQRLIWGKSATAAIPETQGALQ